MCNCRRDHEDDESIKGDVEHGSHLGYWILLFIVIGYLIVTYQVL